MLATLPTPTPPRQCGIAPAANPPAPAAAVGALWETVEEIAGVMGRLVALVPVAFPLGARVEYLHGKRRLAATVVGHSADYTPGGPHLLVEGTRGRRYRLSVAKVLRAMPREGREQ